MSRKASVSVVIVMLAWLANATLAAAFQPIATTPFLQTWGRTDQLVSTGQVHRTWMWGPGATSVELYEPYSEAPGGERLVQYFDKSRMEDNSYNSATAPWNVTNGLLAKELITGQLQLGNNSFEQHDPAQINVAGDANDPNGPTYATFNPLMNYSPIPNGWIITQTIDRAGTVGAEQQLANYGVTATDVGAPTKHNVASVFWDFMNSSGPIAQNGQVTEGKLFQNPFYATGYPLTEAYWTHVLVGGVQKLVLVQVFERRVLTYTPSNAGGWQVEAGNVGLQYYTWRYVQLGKTPDIVANPPVTPVPPPTNAIVVQDPPPTTTTIGSVVLRHANVTFYEVTGNTATELESSMNTAGPIGANGAHFDGYTSWQFRWNWSETSSNGVCHPTNVRVTYSITITLPQWTPPANADPALVDKWNQFTEALATHEDGHAIRVTNGANQMGAEIADAACGEESTAAQAALSAIQQASDEYDAQTQHGATQGATWP